MLMIGRDLTQALRSLFKDRTFTFVCVISLGIGMGAFVALVTFTRMITSPARGIDTNGLTELLVLPTGPLRARSGTWALERWSYPDCRALRESKTGMSITGWASEFSDFGERPADGTAPLRATTLFVSANYFRTFGVSLALGAGFDPAIDDVPTAEPRVVLSHPVWRTRMASDPDIVGKSVTIDGIRHTVVGVAPEGFNGHFHIFQTPDLLVFVPLERHPRLTANPKLREDRSMDWVRMHGRLDPDIDMAQANGLVAATVSGLAQQYRASNEFKAATVQPYASLGAVGRPESRRAIAGLLGLSGAVLMVVCLNISGMMLVRGATRERELGIRAALGAGRRRLIQQLFLEAVLLAFVGGALSALVLFGIPAMIAWWVGAPIPQEIDFDVDNAAIAAGLCLLVSVLFGLLPAVRFSRPSLLPALKDDAGGGGRKTIRVHRVAAMAQIGIAMPFLAISGVMLDRVRTADFGFPTNGLAAARLPTASSPTRAAGMAVRQGRELLQQAGSVRSVAVAEGMPIDFDYRMFRVAPTDRPEFISAHVTRVGENFLETIGAPLLRGRTITAEDRIMAAPVAVISKPLADQLFPATEPIGERVRIMLEEGREQDLTIVGVSADFATSQLTTERPQMFLPLPESFTGALADVDAPVPTIFLIARGAPGDEPHLKAALENVLRELGVDAQPGVAFPGIVTGSDLVEKSVHDLIFESVALAVAGGVVLVLAALGIVGVVGFMVATRTRELAVRIALGATRLRVFGLILWGIVKLAIPGVAGGLLLAAVLIRTMDNVMGTPLTVGPTPLGVMEPLIYALASAIAVSVGLLASLPAARRATTIQPMVAMRSE